MEPANHPRARRKDGQPLYGPYSRSSAYCSGQMPRGFSPPPTKPQPERPHLPPPRGHASCRTPAHGPGVPPPSIPAHLAKRPQTSWSGGVPKLFHRQGGETYSSALWLAVKLVTDCDDIRKQVRRLKLSTNSSDVVDSTLYLLQLGMGDNYAQQLCHVPHTNKTNVWGYRSRIPIGRVGLNPHTH